MSSEFEDLCQPTHVCVISLWLQRVYNLYLQIPAHFPYWKLPFQQFLSKHHVLGTIVFIVIIKRFRIPFLVHLRVPFLVWSPWVFFTCAPSSPDGPYEKFHFLLGPKLQGIIIIIIVKWLLSQYRANYKAYRSYS